MDILTLSARDLDIKHRRLTANQKHYSSKVSETTAHIKQLEAELSKLRPALVDFEQKFRRTKKDLQLIEKAQLKHKKREELDKQAKYIERCLQFLVDNDIDREKLVSYDVWIDDGEGVNDLLSDQIMKVAHECHFRQITFEYPEAWDYVGGSEEKYIIGEETDCNDCTSDHPDFPCCHKRYAEYIKIPDVTEYPTSSWDFSLDTKLEDIKTSGRCD